MKNRSKLDVEVFAGIDVSAREISVARLQGEEENPTLATFANTVTGHKALLAFLLRGTDRVGVCLESSGNYSLDLALTLHSQRQVEVSVGSAP
jgi:transposase